AGDCAGFKGGDPDGHCLQNRGTADVIVLEIGSRIPGEYAAYSDIDMKPSPASRMFTRTVGPIPRCLGAGRASSSRGVQRATGAIRRLAEIMNRGAEFARDSSLEE